MSPPPPPVPKEHFRMTVTDALVGAVVGALTVLIIALVFFMWYRNKKKREMEILRGHPPSPTKNGHQNAPPAFTAPPVVFVDSHVSSPAFTASDPHLTSGSLGSEKRRHSPSPSMCGWLAENTFAYEELEKATNGFAEANFLGQGGFGYVHKGVLDNGKVVAVKQLKPESRQGEREFHAEIGIISRVQHPHLVSLLGYCINGAHSLLVYEFVPNNNLEFHLHGKENPTISWSTRMKIALGAAKGLAFLHEDCQPKIIHRDVKASNILLDNNFEAKVSDFGLAKDFADTDTHVSTRVVGTFGYMAPEYAATGKLTHKSDVFSFGVVLLELITGRQPVVKTSAENAVSIVDWSRPLLKQALEDGNYEPVVDPKLLKKYNGGEMTRMIACAATCVDYSAKLRPRMSQIVRTLEGNMSLDDVIEGTPGMDNRSDQSRKQLKALWKTALGSFGSSEYSAASIEYGHQAPRSSSHRQQATLQIEPSKSEK